jgi:hypothetical protein
VRQAKRPLKTFVTETLQQICDGIREAQKQEGGSAINAEGIQMQSAHLIDAGTYGIFTRVNFEVAVSAETSGGGKGSIKVWQLFWPANHPVNGPNIVGF